MLYHSPLALRLAVLMARLPPACTGGARAKASSAAPVDASSQPDAHRTPRRSHPCSTIKANHVCVPWLHCPHAARAVVQDPVSRVAHPPPSLFFCLGTWTATRAYTRTTQTRAQESPARPSPPSTGPHVCCRVPFASHVYEMLSVCSRVFFFVQYEHDDIAYAHVAEYFGSRLL
jgi:hypothetical protein